MENLKPIKRYAQFRYTPHDDEIRAGYAHILNLFPDHFTDTEYREEIALLMAHINALLKQGNNLTIEKTSEGISNEQWKIILDTIKLKASLIREQRIHNLRIEKARIEQLKIDIIPKDEFLAAINEIVNLVKDYIEPQFLPSFVSQMKEVLQKTTKRNDTITLRSDNLDSVND